MLYSTILGYFALNDMQDQIGERQTNSVCYRAPSYGLFKTSLQPQYWFGMGDLPFRDAPISVMLDSEQSITELSESNNLESTENPVGLCARVCGAVS